MRILFLFHDANRTGATLTLYRMVRWLSANTDFSMTFLFRDDGILVADFGKLGPVHFWNPNSARANQSLLQKGYYAWADKAHRKSLVRKFRKENFDLVYGNTIGTSAMINSLSSLGIPVVWHLHELDLAIRVLGKARMDSGKFVQTFIANSNSTADNLIKLGIDRNKIRIIHPVIDLSEIVHKASTGNLREKLGIPKDAFVIGSSGTGIERKGISTFIQLPVIVDYFYPENHFYYLWVGKIFDPEIYERDIGNQGLTGRFLFTGELENPYPHYDIFDLFVSCSKEESFGLSALEAGALGKPMICFEKTGGLEEVVREAGNITVPYLDLIALANRIIDFSRDPDLARQMGAKAADFAKQFDLKLIIPEFVELLHAVKKEI